MSSADLHLFSKHSQRAADWVLRRLGLPASYSDPAMLYDRMREKGHDFFTLTDQNSIQGCLEIADRPGVFISEEVTTSFPEDGCKVVVLVWGLDERQHREIEKLRDNLYDFQRFLVAEHLVHAVAHPFHGPDDKWTDLHQAKLALLFRHFEAINGLRQRQLSEAAGFALARLTPEDIDRLQNVTGLEATHAEPWRKVFLGGSGDQGNVDPGRAWTETPGASTVAEFLDHIRHGRCSAKGNAGSALLHAHNQYSTAFRYARAKLGAGNPGADLVEKFASRFMEGRDPTNFTLAEKLTFVFQGIASGQIFDMAKPGTSSLWKELAVYFSQPSIRDAFARETAGVPEPERRAFLMANLIANQLAYRFFNQFLSQLTAGKFLESIQLLSALVPIVFMLSPYLAAFRSPRRERLRSACETLCGESPDSLKNGKRAWFTDTLEDVNGVATTIRKMVGACVAGGRELTVVTSRSSIEIDDVPIRNFVPIGEFELPEYELQRLSFPPILQIIDYIEQENFSELIISTPGPVGLVALLAAQVLGLRTSSIYHTDFPQYVRILTEDSLMETLTWNYMHWFYSQCDVVYVNSQDYLNSWRERGIPEERLKVLPRGLDTALFNPAKRDASFWPGRGLRKGELAMLYVGRVSREKNLDILVAATRQLQRQGAPIRPVLVGDGPYLKEMKKLMPDAIFTGYLRGEELARAYASSDFFVFPSTTDTFGNVILEAQASGLPCVVTDLGGPRELVTHGEDGIITRALDVIELSEAVTKLAEDQEFRSRLGKASRAKVAERSWARAADDFWKGSPP